MTLSATHAGALATDEFVNETACYREALVRDGHVIVRGLVPTHQVRRFGAELSKLFEACPICDGNFYGFRTKRFGKLLSRTEGAAALVMNPTVLGIIEPLLLRHCDNIQLNLTQAIQICGGEAQQVPHCDEDMWQGPKGEMEYLINVIWPTGVFNAENGATRLWPKSRPQTDILEPIAPQLAPGDALLWLGSTLHGGGPNRSGIPRSAFLASYCLGWLKPFENQWLSYPPDVARHFPDALAALVGYRQHRPNLGNLDGQCPSDALRPGGDALRAAVDSLRPEQALALAKYAEAIAVAA